MKPPEIPDNESERLAAVRTSGLLDTPPEPVFDDLVRLAARLCGTPIAGLSLIDERREWFKAAIGLDRREVERARSFGAHVILQPGLFVVEDPARDERFAENPLVTGEPRAQFYAAAPVTVSGGLAVGTVFVMDPRGRSGLGDEAADALRVLARQAAGLVEGRLAQADLTRLTEDHRVLRESEERFRLLAESIGEVFWLADWREHRVVYVSPAYEQVWGRSRQRLYEHPLDWEEAIHPADRARVEEAFLRHAAEGTFDEEYRIIRPDGSIRWIRDRGFPVRDERGEVTLIAGLAIEITKRKQAEEELREAEFKYHSIFEHATEGIFQTTPDGHYLSANPMLARIYGYDSPEELMRAVQDIKRQIYVEAGRREEFIRCMQENDVIRDFESRVYRKDGSIIWISENARAVRDPQGQLLYYEGTVRDITDRKQAQEALRESEMLYHSLVETLPVNLFRKDLQERFTFANQRFCETLGRPLGEILGRTDFDFFPEELARKYQQDDRRVMETGKTFETVEENQTPDGEKHYVEVIKAPIYDVHGNIAGVQGIFMDVTQRKRIERALAHERDLLRALLDHVPDRIYFKDTQSRFVKCSRALAHRLGLEDPEEAVGKTDFDFHPEDKAREFFEDEQRVLATGVPLVNKVERQVGLDGTTIWASVTKVPVYGHDGRVAGIIGISRDITALKKIEAELALNRDAALELARQKSQFLATMSHEIRTPMNGILGMIGLLLDTKLSARQRDFAETIRASADALLNIINDILDFSKIEAGKLSFESIDFDLRETIEAAVEPLAERAQAKGIELMAIVPPEVPVAVRGDPGRLRQVLTNLVGNAIKFTEHGEVVVRVETERETDREVTVRCSVRDTGIGVPEEARSRIFESFTQADGSTTRKYGGTGLGLAICRQLIELQGGQIGFESQPGAGSTFWFRLTFARQPAQTTAGAPPGPGGLRVLVVDDNATARELLREKLAPGGLLVTTAAGAAEAIIQMREEAAAGQPFQVVLADQDMPETDGLSLARSVKADPALAHPRFVLLTAIGEPVEAPLLRAAGVFATLSKPVRQSRLMECLRRAAAGERHALPAESRAAAAGETAFERGHPASPPLRILLAEDNPVNQKVAVQQLLRLGHCADTVATGRDVLVAVKRARYDVILMDCQMPEMDGYEATRQIREQERAFGEGTLPPVYIIAMTANALAGDREECLAAGMNDYIVKPVRLAELKTALARAVDRAHQSAAPAAPAPPEAVTFDTSVLTGLRELREPGGADPLVELIDLFLRDTDSQVRKMQSAHDRGDPPVLKTAAHSLKGSANNMGARRLARLCAAVEQAAAKSDLAAAGRLLQDLVAEFAKVRERLETERSKANAE